MNHLNDLISQIASNPWAAIVLILNICLLEIILSLDNVAVLAILIKDMPKDQQSKALRYGILGAYIFRGLALIFATVLINIWWLKPLGGIYLLYLTYNFFKGKSAESTDDEQINKNDSWIYKMIVGVLGTFWSTVVMIEILDLSFSIDNVLAVVAFSNNIVLICLGVFIGILAMRFVAMKFVKLMEKYPFLETAAFVVIGLLGLKLFMSLIVHFFPDNLKWIESENFDWIMSGITLLVFFLPLAYHKIFVRKDDKLSDQQIDQANESFNKSIK